MHTSMAHQDANAVPQVNRYEVQGFVTGEWRILSVCVNSAAAMHEVAEARRSGKYLGIRVTVECFDQIARKHFSRVVYHYSPLTERRPSVPKAAHTLLGQALRPAAAAKSSPASDFLAHSYLNWMVTTRLALAMGVAVVAVMAISLH